MEKRNIEFLNDTSDVIFKILCMGEEKIIDPLKGPLKLPEELEWLKI
jgi:hypothetical protein